MDSNISKARIMSLDMFRGFAIFGMILVNYLGQFDVIPETFKHPRYGMTFANAIAPYFLFAVGMGLKMSLERRIKKAGVKSAYFHAIKRYLIDEFSSIEPQEIGISWFSEPHKLTIKEKNLVIDESVSFFVTAK